MLETIRQFAEDQLAATGTIDEVRDRHARYFAEQAVAHWDIWDGPRQRVALDWVDVEFANLRAGFRWAADQGDLATAAAIAAHTAMLNWALQRFEPVGWAEEILARGHGGRSAPTPRLYSAASLCQYHRTPRSRRRLRADARSRWRPIPATTPSRPDGAGCWRPAPTSTPGGSTAGWRSARVGRPDRVRARVRPVRGASAQRSSRGGPRRPSPRRRCSRRPRPRQSLLDRVRVPGYARAFTETDVARALTALRQGLAYTREHRLPLWEALLARDAARLEALHGDPEQALALFDTALEYFHRAGDLAQLPSVFAYLAGFFDRFGAPEVAATVYGASTHGRFNSARSVVTRAARRAGRGRVRPGRRRRSGDGHRRGRALCPPADPTCPPPRGRALLISAPPVVARPAARAIAEALPEPVAAAVIDLVTGPLLRNPKVMGKPLHRELAGLWSARRARSGCCIASTTPAMRFVVLHV